ncbi:response regulator [Uliginosibacterium gangwonense]|uniref:response regulator n=1 Tax=Uliginosibacterium gangwonense TaxID=392736 RepID=UPI00036A6DF0|nr:response regulator [Uliginosibacterium gangwonense]
MAQIFDVLIVEDELRQAELHVDHLRSNNRFRPVGLAGTLAEARKMIDAFKPRLILLDNYLPDGKGIDLLEYIVVNKIDARVIFLTAASEMETCSKAISYGAFDYIIKPIAYERMDAALARFCQFMDSQQTSRLVDQRRIDELYNLQSRHLREERRTKGIEDITLARVKDVFLGETEQETTDSVARLLKLSKTTARRYLEYCVEIRFLRAEIVHGKVGRPERVYKRVTSG